MYYNSDFTKMVFRRAQKYSLFCILSLDFNWDSRFWSKHLIYCLNSSEGWMVAFIKKLFVSKRALKLIPLLPNTLRLTAFVGECWKILTSAEDSSLFLQASLLFPVSLNTSNANVLLICSQVCVNKQFGESHFQEAKINFISFQCHRGNNESMSLLQESIRHISVTRCPNLCWSSLCWQNSLRPWPHRTPAGLLWYLAPRC